MLPIGVDVPRKVHGRFLLVDWPEHVVGIEEILSLVVRSWWGLRSARTVPATFNLNDPVSVTVSAAATTAASRTTRSTARLASWWASGSFVVGVVVVVVVAAVAAATATTTRATRSTA